MAIIYLARPTTDAFDAKISTRLRQGELQLALEDYSAQGAATWIVFLAPDQLPTRPRFLIDFLAERIKDAEAVIEHVEK